MVGELEDHCDGVSKRPSIRVRNTNEVNNIHVKPAVGRS